MYNEPKLKEECGVFGIYNNDKAAHLTYLGLHALQHRGQESAGIVTLSDKFDIHRGTGLVTSVFDEDVLDNLKGDTAIGHVRYSTTGASLINNAQPLLVNSAKGTLALAHNGNLTNGFDLKQRLEKEGSIFHTTLDTEVIAHLVARSNKGNLRESLLDALLQIKGAFSLVALTKENLYGVRDPNGFRPLCIGKLDDSYVLASETCALDIMGAEYVRDVKPGEMVIINEDGLRSFQYAKGNPSFCVFEYIYFARPDSVISGKNVHLARMEMGRMLAREVDEDIDVVIPVPASGISAAQGFAEEQDVPYQWGLIKNRYVGRTFISPDLRDLKVKLKLSPITEIVKDKRVLLVDDSIVRGNTSRRIIKMIRERGAKEVHFGVSSPPVTHSCYYGLDTSNRQELIAAQIDVDEICQQIGADSLHYLSIEGMLEALKDANIDFCTACFDGNYPVGEGTGKHALEKGGAYIGG